MGSRKVGSASENGWFVNLQKLMWKICQCFEIWMTCLKSEQINYWFVPSEFDDAVSWMLYNWNLDDSEHACKLIQKWMLCIVNIQRLDISYCKTWAYSTNSLGHCGFSAASTHKLAFTSRHYTLLTATAIHLCPNCTETMLLIVQIAHYSMCSFKLCPPPIKKSFLSLWKKSISLDWSLSGTHFL